MKRDTGLKNNQDGLVALLVSIVFILVLSLIVVAFSQITRREQRQALDRQLSTQAFYAAESGVNTTLNMIRTAEKNGTPIDEDTSNECEAGYPRSIGESDSNTSVTCVIWDRQPEVLEYTSIDTDNGKLIPLLTTNGNPTSVTIEWNEAEPEPSGNYSGCGATLNLQKPGGICGAGFLRLTAITTSGGLSKQNLYEKAMTQYLRPTPGSGGTTVLPAYTPHGAGDASPSTQGNVRAVDCGGTPARCRAVVSLPGGPVTDETFLHIRSITKANAVSIKVTGAEFVKAQIEIDSTGKASDVLRRIKTRISYFDDMQIPSYALDAENICKKPTLRPEVGQTYNVNLSPTTIAAASGPLGAVYNNDCGSP